MVWFNMSDMHAMQVTAVSGALTDCYWPVSAGRHYGVRWSSRMQTLGQLECK